jgi:hypothetical protein
MIFLKDLVLLTCIGALMAAAATVTYDIYLAFELDRILRHSERQTDNSISGAEGKN